MIEPQRLPILEKLTGLAYIDGFIGLWLVDKIPGQAWGESLRFAAHRVAEKDKVRSYSYKPVKLTCDHAEYMGILMATFKEHEGRDWCVVFLDGALTDPLMQALTAFHESAHLLLGFGGTPAAEAACEAYADKRMAELFGPGIAAEVVRRRDAGTSCLTIPGIERVSETLRVNPDPAISMYGLLLGGRLAMREKPEPATETWAGIKADFTTDLVDGVVEILKRAESG